MKKPGSALGPICASGFGFFWPSLCLRYAVGLASIEVA
jgi:hypothetical protein